MRFALLRALFWVVIIIGVAIGAARIYLGRESEVRSWSGEFVSFDRLPPKSSDHFLICPPGECAGSADAESPLFPVPVDRLHDIWTQTLARDQRLRLVRQDQDGRYLGYVQRSAVLGLPEFVSVQFVPVGDTRSGVKIYSAPRYEALDFGGSRHRAEEWLHRLMQNFPDLGAPLGGG